MKKLMNILYIKICLTMLIIKSIPAMLTKKFIQTMLPMKPILTDRSGEGFVDTAIFSVLPVHD